MRPSYRWVRWCSGTLHGGHGKPSSHWCFFLITRSAGGGGKREKRSSVKAAHSVTHLPPTAHSWGRAGGRRLASGEGRPGLLSPKESLGFRAARRPSESNLISPPRPPRLAQQGSASSDAGTGLLGEEAGVRTLPSSGAVMGPGGHEACTWTVGTVSVAGVGVLRFGITRPPALPSPGPSPGPHLCAHVLSPSVSVSRARAGTAP